MLNNTQRSAAGESGAGNTTTKQLNNNIKIRVSSNIEDFVNKHCPSIDGATYDEIRKQWFIDGQFDGDAGDLDSDAEIIRLRSTGLKIEIVKTADASSACEGASETEFVSCINNVESIELYNPDMTDAYLTMLEPNPNGIITFQTFDEDKVRKSLSLSRIFHITRAKWRDRLSDLTNLSEQGAGIFVCVNETDGKGRSKQNIIKVRAVWADFDEANSEQIKSARDQLEPSIEVQTSAGKYHFYWLVKDAMELKQCEKLIKIIAAKYGADKNVSDYSRVLRVPGFPHQKGEAQPVILSGFRGEL